MTNLFAVEFQQDSKPYIFFVCDSQSSGGNTKDPNNQKLILRGRNLVMATGARELALAVYRNIGFDDIACDDLARRIVDTSEGMARDLEGKQKMQTSFLIGGADSKGKPAMYEVILLNTELQKRGHQQFQGVYGQGSGMEQASPAYKREFEKGIQQHPTCAIEAMLMCYSVGLKADQSQTVNDRMQFGVFSPDGSRVLMPRDTNFVSMDDANAVYTSITGVKFDIGPKVSDERNEELLAVRRTVGSFYHAFDVMMRRFDHLDIECNRRHTQFKTDPSAGMAYWAAVEKRREAAEETKRFVDAFMHGGTKRLADAANSFYIAESALMEQAIKVK